MDLKQLRTLVAIAEHGTFAGAADAVGLTQSAVSLHIKHLEEELGTLLFDRSCRPPRLNARGLSLVEQAGQVIGLCDQMNMDAVRGTVKGSLSFGAVPSCLISRMPQALIRLRGLYPQLRVRVASGSSVELAARVRSAELDAALVSEPAENSDDLVSRQICQEPLCVVAPADAQGDTDKEILEALPYIQFNKRAWAGRLIHRSLVARKIRTDLMMEIDSLEAITQMVEHGLGASIVPLPSLQDCDGKAVRVMPFGDPPIYRSIVVIERQAGRRAPFVAALVDVLQALA